MGKIGKALEGAAKGCVAAHGVVWHFETVRSSDVQAAGVAQLLMLNVPTIDSDTTAKLEADPMAAIRAMGEKGARERGRINEALVCAGVVGAEIEGEEGSYEAVTVVMDKKGAKPADNILWVGALSASTVSQIADAITELSSGADGRLADAVRSFRK